MSVAFDLDQKYDATDGTILLSGIQALVRTMLDHRRLDAQRGLDTRAYVSGYPGSPLGGVDRELARVAVRLDHAGVVFAPGLNEELAATAVAGTQLLGQVPGRRHDGVVGYWFGKNPGLDRAADAIRHANVAGTAALGGAVALIGDDPSSKSSTVPSTCEAMARSLFVPLLSPGTVAEALELGLHAAELSRHTGLWCGVKIVADVADASGTVDVTGLLDRVPDLPRRDDAPPAVLLPPTNLDAEFELLTARLMRASEYARAASLNEIVFEPRRARVAVVAAGPGFQAVLRALDDLGLDGLAREALGLRLVRLSMPWPLDTAAVRGLLRGVDTVLVVEDKLPFVEARVKEALYATADAPQVLGKTGVDGRPLLPLRGAVSAEDVASALEQIVPGIGEAPRARRVLPVAAAGAPLPRRTPFFCSGCPHNVSTRASADTLTGVGIGCHIMVKLDEGARRGNLVGMPQMGGEGAQWFGLAPFTDDRHFVQNLGDGTFHHSGSLAIRAAVAAGADMTFKLLYNDAVAMTGGQQAPGRMDIPAMTRSLEAEGVARIVVTTPEPKRYRRVELASIATVRHRDEIAAVEDELAEIRAVTVLIHDDQCATEKRRLRKRGALPQPSERIMINERVCEGCGDCGDVSTCLALEPVETEFGRKTQVNQTTCNHDRACLKGDCPSFVMVTPQEPARKRTPPPTPPTVAEPTVEVPDDVLVRLPGVGGTGVVTVSQILQAAAHIDGLNAAGVEQIGLAQKGGPVISDLRISRRPIEGHLRATTGSADAIVGFDLLGAAAPETLSIADPSRTVAVVSTSPAPTARMVTDVHAGPLDEQVARRRVDAVTKPGANLYIDAIAHAERLFDDQIPANMLLVGAAFQHRCLPLTAAAIEQAIRVNGAAVDVNLSAFRWGRALAADAEATEGASPSPAPAPAIDPHAVEIVAGLELPAEARAAVTLRVSELIAYQNVGYARWYGREVGRVARVAEERVGAPGVRVTDAFARGLHKLMAYKDEYEVARLHLDPVEVARRDARFGPSAKVELLLQPPALRSLGLDRKVRIGARGQRGLRVLAGLRRVRGTVLDPFGRAEIRRLERALPREYVSMVDAALAQLDVVNLTRVVEVAELPDLVRGYEQIKLRNVQVFRARSRELLEALA